MRFSLKHLKYLNSALTTGSIAKAAAEMNISQSSITAAIDLIEQEVGLTLFQRIPAKGLTPTDHGVKIGRRVAQFLEQARLFEADVLSIAGDPAGTLRMTCYAPAASMVLPRILMKVTENFPSVHIEMKEGDMPEMLEMLQTGSVDMALTYQRATPYGTHFQPLFAARPWALLPMGDPLANQSSVTIADLAPKPLIMLNLTEAREYFHSLFSDQGLDWNLVHQTKSSNVVRGMVAANLGYSLLTICGPHDRSPEAGYVAMPITGDFENPVFGVAYTKFGLKSKIVQSALDICNEMAKQNVYDDLVLRP